MGFDLVNKAISRQVMSLQWPLVGKLDTVNGSYDVARLKGEENYIVGNFRAVSTEGKKPGTVDGKTEFAVVMQIRLSAVANLSFRDKGKVLGYPNLFKVNVVAVPVSQRGTGIAKALYKWFVSENMMILGDREQYFGARKLWAALSRDTDVVVDIIDYDEELVISRNVTLHHGQYDQDFDRRVWSYKEDLQHIRLVLRNVI